jgi:hypothetical protein
MTHTFTLRNEIAIQAPIERTQQIEVSPDGKTSP